jgi:TMEM175 potassium channel family protein
MRTIYNVFAGNSVERIAALSDGVFAVAMTLLILDIRPPSMTGHSEAALLAALVALAPQFIAYFMSFTTLGIFWVGQQTQLNLLARSDRDLTWLHLGFLLTVMLMPFSTALLAHYITFRVALVVYWGNIVLLGTALYITWSYTRKTGLTTDDVTPDLDTAVRRRILGAQALYALAALLCIFNTWVSITAIVLLQLNFVFAPRIRPLYKI